MHEVNLTAHILKEKKPVHKLNRVNLPIQYNILFKYVRRKRVVNG